MPPWLQLLHPEIAAGQLRLALVRDPASGGSTAFAQISSREDAVHGPSVTIEPTFAPATTLGITADQPCSIVTKRDVDGGLTVAVADPQQSVGQIHLTLDRAGFSSWSGDPTVEVLSLNNPVQLVVNTAGSRGASHQVVLARGHAFDRDASPPRSTSHSAPHRSISSAFDQTISLGIRADRAAAGT